MDGCPTCQNDGQPATAVVAQRIRSVVPSLLHRVGATWPGRIIAFVGGGAARALGVHARTSLCQLRAAEHAPRAGSSPRS